MRLAAIPFAAFALSLGFVFSQANPSQEIKSMDVKRITPVLLVKEIEPLIPFWVVRLGFTNTIEVHDGNSSGLWAFLTAPAEVRHRSTVSVHRGRLSLLL